MTLSCSRHSYEEPLWGQDRTHFLRAHEHAFQSFGGVPATIRHDNLKAAVVRASLYDPDVSEMYAAFARHWGFVPLPGRPRHPQEQGIAERGGGYVKSNARKGRRFDSLEELDSFLKRWNRTVARLRIHGITRQQVYTHFLEVDQPALQSLPQSTFSLFEVGTRTVHPDGHIQIEGAFYSVPHTLMGDWACGVALERRVFRYATLQRLVEQASAQTPAPQLQLLQQHPLIRDLREYTEEVLQ